MVKPFELLQVLIGLDATCNPCTVAILFIPTFESRIGVAQRQWWQRQGSVVEMFVESKYILLLVYRYKHFKCCRLPE